MSNLTALRQAVLHTSSLDSFWISPSDVEQLIQNVTDQTWQKCSELRVAFDHPRLFYQNVDYMIETDFKGKSH